MKLIALLLSLTTASAFAANVVTTFTCEMEKFPGHAFTFKMKNLEKPSMTFLRADSDDEYSEVFSTKSRNKTVKALVSTLNGQGGDLRVEKDRITFFGDDAGIELAWFSLFKDKGYKSGFARMQFDFGNEKDYSTVSCKLSK